MRKTAIGILAVMLLLATSALAENPVGKGMIQMAGGWSGNFALKGGDLNKGDSVYNVSNSTWEEGESITHFGVDPSIAYFFMDGLAVGAVVAFESTSKGDAKSTMWALGPKVFFYPTGKNVDDPKGKLIPRVSGQFTIGSQKNEDGGASGEGFPGLPKLTGANDAPDDRVVKHSLWAARFTAGGVWMLANSWGVHAEAYFELQNSKQKEPKPVEGEPDYESVSGNEFGIMIGVTGFFGTAN